MAAGKDIRQGALASMTIVLMVDGPSCAGYSGTGFIGRASCRLIDKALPQSATNFAQFEKDEQQRAASNRERRQRTPRHPRWWLSF